MEKYNFGPNVIYLALGIKQSCPAGAFWADQIEFWARNASHRGLLGGSNCILNRKSLPQGPFGRPRVSKKRPGGAKLDLVVFYKLFKRPQSTGRLRGIALITYRLGRLTEQ